MFREVKDGEVDIVVAAIQPDLTSFLESWRPFFAKYHVIVVKDPDLSSDLKIPSGFSNLDVYSVSEMESLIGKDAVSRLRLSGFSSRYFGYLVSNRKYVISIDTDCLPAKDAFGDPNDAVKRHLANLAVPATPFFFNTLYDPYAEGTDFVRGYPFSLRSGVETAVSCGLWLKQPDLDAEALVKNSSNSWENERQVDMVLTVPSKVPFVMSGVNLAFDRELIGPAMFSGMDGRGHGRHAVVEDVWCGMCVKTVCDRLGYGVKSGAPYVERESFLSSVKPEEIEKSREGGKLMDKAAKLFEGLTMPVSAVTAEDCVLEIAKKAREVLGGEFVKVADAMETWVEVWRNLHKPAAA